MALTVSQIIAHDKQVYIGSSSAGIGDHIADFTEDTGADNLPMVLLNGDEIDNVRDLHELQYFLELAGVRTETDYDGLVVVGIDED